MIKRNYHYVVRKYHDDGRLGYIQRTGIIITDSWFAKPITAKDRAIGDFVDDNDFSEEDVQLIRFARV